VVRTLQATWTETALTWIIGRTEHALVGDIPGIDFIIFDKGRGWRAYADLRRHLRNRRFDALLHMQMSLRASLASRLVRTPIRLGFDRQRAKDGQWLFTNFRIPHHPRQHVLESLFGFTEALGIDDRLLRWGIPIPDMAARFASEMLPDGTRAVIISPCSSHAYRNWTVEGYAAVANHASQVLGLQVVLTGGNRSIERHYADAISARLTVPPIDLTGRTDLKQLLALMARAEAVVAPDSGPAHMATTVGTPVVGLYAATNPDRARPYLSGPWVVSRYREAVAAHYGKLPEQLPWGARVRAPDTMERIPADEVIKALDKALAGSAGPEA